MKVTNQGDGRFTEVYGAKIIAVYRRIPLLYNEWLLDIRYKDCDEDLFETSKVIKIQDARFINDIIVQNDQLNDRAPGLQHKVLRYAFGGQDIDMRIGTDGRDNPEFVIMWSPNQGAYVNFHFGMEEYNDFVQTVRRHADEFKPTGFFSMFTKTYKIVEDK